MSQSSLFPKLPIFDRAEAFKERDRAIDRIEQNANEDFKEASYHAIVAVAHRVEYFIVDEVWKQLGTSCPPVHDKRAIVYAFNRAKAEGLIVPTSRKDASAQKQCHGNYRTVWRSLVCAPL